jgi:hypothetical protein
MELIIWHYIVVHNWINITVEMIEPQGVSYKMLQDNPHPSKTHKCYFYNQSYGSIQNTLTTSVL